MRLHSYSVAGPSDPSAVILFPRLPTMAQLLSVSIVGTDSAPSAPELKIVDGSNVALLIAMAESVPGGGLDWIVNWLPNQAAGAAASATGNGEVCRGFLPPSLWLPPNWQLSVQLVSGAAPMTITRAQMTFLAEN